MDRQYQTQNMVYAAFFLALAQLLPFITGQIPQIGQMLLPMHLPVILCGFVCGWPWGLITGAIAPILRSTLFGTPVMFPMAICMSVELAVKGAVCGKLYSLMPKSTKSIYLALLVSMIVSRLVYGGAQYVLLGMDTGLAGLVALWSGSVTTALPGILLQLIAIPVLVKAMTKKDWQKGQSYS